MKEAPASAKSPMMRSTGDTCVWAACGRGVAWGGCGWGCQERVCWGVLAWQGGVAEGGVRSACACMLGWDGLCLSWCRGHAGRRADRSGWRVVMSERQYRSRMGGCKPLVRWCHNKLKRLNSRVSPAREGADPN